MHNKVRPVLHLFRSVFLLCIAGVQVGWCGLSLPPVYQLLMLSGKPGKKIFIIGDSTVHRHTTPYLAQISDCGDDNPDGTTFEGWGDELGRYMVYPENCINNARQGANSETYKTPPDDETLGVDRNWQVTRQMIEDAGGGLLLIQFGSSNENSLADTWPERKTLFQNNLRFYIDEARALNALPILVTPPEGRDDGIDAPADGTHPDTRAPYPSYIAEVAAETGTEILDLQLKSNIEFAKYSDQVLLREFGDCRYTNGTTDRVHYEPHGAKKVAGWVTELACTTLTDPSLCHAFHTPVDRVIPEIDLIGDYSVTLPPGESFLDPGATALDDRNGDMTAAVATNGVVYSDDAGEYPVTYDVTDNSGNHAIQVTRMVRVTTGATVREDAQDGDTENWNVYTGTGEIHNLYDRDRHSRVIELAGDNGLDDGFRYFENQDWNTPGETVISWSMKYNEEFTFFVSVFLDDGAYKIFEYRPIDTDMELTTSGRYRFGLGSNVLDGRWHNFTRDLAADLHALDPEASIDHIIRIAIRGSGRVDDIITAERNPRSDFVFNGHRYEIVKTARNRQQAVDDARTKGGYLVNIGSIAENHAVYSRLFRYIAAEEYDDTSSPDGGGAAYAWIGANDTARESTWVWDNNDTQFWDGLADGQAVGGLFNNWGRSTDQVQHEPDNWNNIQDAGALAIERWPTDTGSLGQPSQWNDIDGTTALFYVIEYD
jgi:hypothetical protein